MKTLRSIFSTGVFAILTILACTNCRVSAEELAVKWSATLSSPSYPFGGFFGSYEQVYDIPLSVQPAANGNVLVSYVSGGNGGSGSPQCHLVKYSGVFGAILWQRLDQGGKIITDKNDDVVSISVRTKKYSGNTGAEIWSVPNLTNSSGADGAFDSEGNIFIACVNFSNSTWQTTFAKYAAGNGTTLWTKTFTPPTIMSKWHVAVDPQGDVILCSSSYLEGDSHSSDYYATKLSGVDGSVIWERYYDGPAHGSDGVIFAKADSNGNLFIGGVSEHGDSYLRKLHAIKYSNAGNLEWEHTFELPPGHTYVTWFASAVDEEGNLVASGYYSGSGDPGRYTAKVKGTDGTLLWENKHPGPWGNTMVDDEGNLSTIYPDGNGSRLVTFLAESGELSGSISTNARDPFITFLSNGDTAICGQTIGVMDVYTRVFTTITSPEEPPSVGNLSVTGVTSNSVTLSADINPNGHLTTGKFRYRLAGTTEFTEGPIVNAGKAAVTLPRTQEFLELLPHARYQWQVVFSNPFGSVTVDGPEFLPNAPPVAKPDGVYTLSSLAATTFPVLENDESADGDPLIILQCTQPPSGSVSITNNNTLLYTPDVSYAYRYTPVDGYVVIDQFTYTIGDGFGGQSISTVKLRIKLPPTLSNPTVSNISHSGAGFSVTVNPNGNKVNVGSFECRPVGTIQYFNGGPANPAFYPDGYTGAVHQMFTGLTPGLEYEWRAIFTSSVGTTILSGPNFYLPNTPPVAQNDGPTGFFTTWGPEAVSLPILDNDSDPDGDVLKIVSVTQGSHGTVSILNGGLSISYDPNNTFSGSDSFTYGISDGFGGTANATVNVQINNPPGTPINPLTWANNFKIVAMTGDPVAGKPSSIFNSLGIPGLDGDTPLFRATLRHANGGVEDAVLIHRSSGIELIQQADAPFGYTIYRRFLKFGDPFGNDGCAIPGRLNTGPVVWSNSFNDGSEWKISSGAKMNITTDGIYRVLNSVGNFTLNDDCNLLWTAQLKDLGMDDVSDQSDQVLLQRHADASQAHILLREGQKLNVGGVLRTIKKIDGLLPPPTGNGDGRYNGGASTCIRVTFNTGKKGILLLNKDTEPRVIAMVGETEIELNWQSLGLPAMAGENVVFRGSTRSNPARSTHPGSQGIYKGTTTGLERLAGTGEYDPDRSDYVFHSFEDPTGDGEGNICFTAKTKRQFGSSALTEALYYLADGDATTQKVVRVGDELIDIPATRIASILSYSLPHSGAYGPVFTATLKPGVGGVTPNNQHILCVTDSSNVVHVVARTGTAFTINGEVVSPAKTIAKISALSYVNGSPATARTCGENSVIFHLKFTDQSQAIVHVTLP